jgi:hypothetical protein
MKRKKLMKIAVIAVTLFILTALFAVPALAAGDVATAVQNTWTAAKTQIQTVVNNVVFPAIDMILAILFFVKIGTAYMDYRKHGQFEFTAPANISVLSAVNIELKVRHLLMVLSSAPDIELLCMDSCECFDDNKAYIKQRLADEPNPAVRAVLEKDMDFLDNIQIEMSTARQFLFIGRIKSGNEEQVFGAVNRTEKIIAEQGFEVRRLKKPDIKRLLALYFGVSTNGELMGDFDGEMPLRALKKGKKPLTDEEKELLAVKSFFDMILPSTVRFYPDHYLAGDRTGCVWAIREYPPSTEEKALFSQLADRTGVTLRMYNRPVDSMEQRKIIQNATRKNKLMTGGSDVQDTVNAEGNLQDVVELIANLRRNREPLLHCAVFLELRADSLEHLKELQSDILMELTRAKMTVDRLTLRQKEGFLSAPEGTKIYASKPGKVLFVRFDADGYGKFLVVNHGGGEATLYGHRSEILVREDDAVTADTVIARVGNTGRSTGAHCHFEIILGGKPVNPLKFLRVRETI